MHASSLTRRADVRQARLAVVPSRMVRVSDALTADQWRRLRQLSGERVSLLSAEVLEKVGAVGTIVGALASAL